MQINKVRYTKLYKAHADLPKEVRKELLDSLKVLSIWDAVIWTADFLGGAFIWSRSPQGRAYWKNLSDKIDRIRKEKHHG